MFDSHCHFDFAVFDQARDRDWQVCRELGVTNLLMPGVAPAQWGKVAQLAQTYPGLYCAAGLHPWWGAQWLEEHSSFQDSAAITSELQRHLRPWLQQPGCVALGECGLDGAIALPLPQQTVLFEAQLQLASEQQLPLIVHVRKSHHQTLQLLKRYNPPCGGVVHGFSGSLELALQYWRMGFYLGVGGTITYERAAKTRATVAALPLEALLLETDGPDMPLFGRQGEPNHPRYLPDIAEVLAQLRGLPVAEVARQTTANSRRLFKL